MDKPGPMSEQNYQPPSTPEPYGSYDPVMIPTATPAVSASDERDSYLRQQALAEAVSIFRGNSMDPVTIVNGAKAFYDFLKGDSSNG